MHRDVLSAFFAVLFLSIVVVPASADNRVALVIGNAPILVHRTCRIPCTTPTTWQLPSNDQALRSWLRPISTGPAWKRR